MVLEMKKYSVEIVFCLVVFYFNVASAETAKISVYENRIMGGEQQLISEVFWTLGGKKYLYFEFKKERSVLMNYIMLSCISTIRKA
jgi:hypothetical protein